MSYKFGEIKKMLNALGPEKLEEMYLEHETLTNLSKHLNISIETLRQYFIKNNIDYTKQVIYDVDHTFFSEDNEKSFYWAGFLAADGNIAKDKPRIYLGLATRDKNHLEKYKTDLKTNAPIFDTVVIDERLEFKTGIYYKSVVRFTSRQIVNDLAKFNIVPAKSLIYSIPEWMEQHPLCNHFIRGLIDGDGCVDCGKIGLCGSLSCVQQTKWIISKNTEITPEQIHIELYENHVPRFTVYEKPARNALFNYLFTNATIWLDRKYDKYIEYSSSGEYIDKKHYLDFTGIDITQNFKDIAKQLNTSVATVQRRLDESGIRPRIHKYVYNGCFDDSNSCEEKFYWLGFLFNLSSFYALKNRVVINFRMKETLDELQKFTNYYNSEIVKIQSSYRLTISSEEIFSKLNEYGIKDKITINDSILSNKYCHHFVRGLIDSHSCLTDNRIVIRTNKLNHDQFCYILNEKIKLDINPKGKISLRKNNIIKLRAYIYKDATIYLKYKFDNMMAV